MFQYCRAFSYMSLLYSTCRLQGQLGGNTKLFWHNPRVPSPPPSLLRRLIFNLFWSPAYVACARFFKTFMEPRNRYQGMNSASLCSLAGRSDNPIPPRFLAPIDSLKSPALAGRHGNPVSTRFLAPVDCSKVQHRTVLVHIAVTQLRREF
jgi:hypothetical protein